MKKKSLLIPVICAAVILAIGAYLWFLVLPRLQTLNEPASTAAPTAAPSPTAAPESTPVPNENALAGFPESVRQKIPAGYNTINEIVTATLQNSGDDVDRIHPRFHFQTVYAEGETVYLVFGLSQGGKMNWFVRQGTGQADGSVGVTLTKKQLDALNGKKFSLVVVCQ